MRDGALLEMQSKYGTKYKKSLGVPIFSLKDIGKDYKRDNELAELFWENGGREQLIMASMLSEPKNIDKSYLEKQIEQIKTPELFEQIVLNLLRFLPDRDVYIRDWLEKGEESFYILAVLLQGHDADSFTEARLSKILSLPVKKGGYLQKCQYRILLKMGIKSEDNYNTIRKNLLVRSLFPVLVEELSDFHD